MNVSLNQPPEAQKLIPKLRSYWSIEGLEGYEFDDYDAPGVIAQLIRNGASTVCLVRHIVDDNTLAGHEVGEAEAEVAHA